MDITRKGRAHSSVSMEIEGELNEITGGKKSRTDVSQGQAIRLAEWLNLLES